MEWTIRGDAPVYAQLVEQITLAIIRGEYPPGERLPSVRELSAEAGVNPNTMQRALSELEREGFVQTQRTAGRTVTEDAARIAAEKRRFADAAVRTYYASMQQLGYERAEAVSFIQQP
ncbi:MAG: GntR family transcriptional regulator [Oscillospiraceae bacterium]|nr:GntR family transcriptional regulator [Oscillospiraceae bacterium]